MPEKILIVDDEPEVTTLMGMILGKYGFEILTATSGRETLAKADEAVPDLILLDIMMPDIDGYQVCRQLRADPHLGHIPIIFLTAKGEVSDRVAGFEAGADEFVTKPIHPDELVARVNAILTRSAAMRASVARAAHVVGILGVKGGLGTTTLAVNVAVSCAASGGPRTLLAEMIPGMATTRLMLGLGETEGLERLMRIPPAELTAREVQNRLGTHSTGLRLLLAPLLHGDSDRWTPEVADAILHHLRRMADLVLLDLGAGLTPVNCALVTAVDQVVLAIGPHPLSLMLAEATLDVLKTMGGGANHVDLVIINRTPSSLTLPLPVVEDTLHRPVTQVISPVPEAMFQATQSRSPLVLNDRTNIASGQYQDLAQKLMRHLVKAPGTPGPEEAPRGAFDPIRRITGPLSSRLGS